MPIYIKVRNPDEVVFEGEVDQISSSNKIGKFDILDNHANFISLIQDSLVMKKAGQTNELKVDSGILRVQENKVFVYLGIKK